MFNGSLRLSVLYRPDGRVEGKGGFYARAKTHVGCDFSRIVIGWHGLRNEQSKGLIQQLHVTAVGLIACCSLLVPA